MCLVEGSEVAHIRNKQGEAGRVAPHLKFGRCDLPALTTKGSLHACY